MLWFQSTHLRQGAAQAWSTFQQALRTALSPAHSDTGRAFTSDLGWSLTEDGSHSGESHTLDSVGVLRENSHPQNPENQIRGLHKTILHSWSKYTILY